MDQSPMESADRQASEGPKEQAHGARADARAAREREAEVRAFVERHQAAVLWFLRFQVRDADRVDVASETFQIAAARLSAFVVPEGRERAGAERCWVLSIARNVAANWRRKHREAECPELGEIRAPGDLERETAAFELARALLWTLPEPLRTIYLWHHQEGLTHQEIAEQLGAPLGTVKTRLRAAQAELDEKIERLCAREKTERGDYLRGVLPFFGLDVLNRALRGAEEDAGPLAPPPRAPWSLHAPHAWLGLTAVTAIAVVGAVDGVARPFPLVEPERTPVAMVAAAATSMPAFTAAPEIAAVPAAPPPPRRPSSGSHRVSSRLPSTSSPRPAPAAPSAAATTSAAPGELSESSLISLARRAMNEGSPQRARVFLLRHGRAYPDGSLAPEREILLRRLSAR